ncbi:hypothetical protein EB796_001559 [Bugula neritina]|uniref:Uncharacterized protein n=1 Tax=Bugula neritina TaxID=10212 RepID=A0A7J7KPR8_BUGNE|nr:hypothetical protein EB796_001559 [Bugula neritina]
MNVNIKQRKESESYIDLHVASNDTVTTNPMVYLNIDTDFDDATEIEITRTIADPLCMKEVKVYISP